MRQSLHKLKVFQDKPTGCTKNKNKNPSKNAAYPLTVNTEPIHFHKGF